MKQPKHIYFEGKRYKVISWLDNMVCFQVGSVGKWRAKSGVKLTKH